MLYQPLTQDTSIWEGELVAETAHIEYSMHAKGEISRQVVSLDKAVTKSSGVPST